MDFIRKNVMMLTYMMGMDVQRTVRWSLVGPAMTGLLYASDLVVMGMQVKGLRSVMMGIDMMVKVVCMIAVGVYLNMIVCSMLIDSVFVNLSVGMDLFDR